MDRLYEEMIKHPGYSRTKSTLKEGEQKNGEKRNQRNVRTVDDQNNRRARRNIKNTKRSTISNRNGESNIPPKRDIVGPIIEDMGVYIFDGR